MESKERFRDNPNGVITDEVTENFWLPKDSYIDLGKWVTWDEAQLYIGTMRQVYAGGFSDWRMPTREEALSLIIPDGYCLDHEGESIPIAAVFVPKAGHRIWTSEVNDEGQALCVNLRDGSTEFVDKSNRDLHSIRGIRTHPKPQTEED